MLLIFAAVITASLFGLGMEILFKKRECLKKYYKYSGFIYGFVASYLALLAIYYQLFDGDFSYWYYITPLNVLVLGMTFFLGYNTYTNDGTTPKRKYMPNGFVLLILFITVYGVICNRLEILFGWNLHFLFFPWHY